MKQNSSSRKVNERAREVIASALLFDISDPRLSLVTITGCEVSFDRSACNVYYTCDSSQYEQVAAAFMKARGHIRSIMAKRLSWRVAPELRFILDSSVDQGERIERALKREADRLEAVQASGQSGESDEGDEAAPVQGEAPEGGEDPADEGERASEDAQGARDEH